MKLFDDFETTGNKINKNITKNVTLETISFEDYYIIDEKINNLENKLSQVSTLNRVKDDLNSKQPGSTEYLVTLESASKFIEVIKYNLGLPSLEDFEVEHAVNDCSRIVTESFTDTIKRIWKAIISFLKDIHKKFSLFFRRLLNLELELKEYEDYVASMINIITTKNSKNSVIDEVPSKLPSMLINNDSEVFTFNDLISYGRNKINSLVGDLERVNSKNLNNISSFLKKNNNLLVETLKKDPNSDVILNLEALTFNASLRNNFFKNSYFSDKKEDIYNKLFSHELGDYSDRGIQLLSISEIIGNEVQTPNGINIYIAFKNIYDERYKILVKPDLGNESSTINVNNTLEVPNTKSLLIENYDYYNNIKRAVNLQDIEKAIDKTQKEIIKISEKLAKTIYDISEKDFGSKNYDQTDIYITNTRKLNGDTSIESIRIKANKYLIDYIEKVKKEGGDRYNKLVNKLFTIYLENETEEDMNIAPGIIINRDEIDVYEKEGVHIVFIKDIDITNLGSIPKDTIDNISKYMNDYITALEKTINAYSTLYINTYMKVRTEYIKYLYNSCKKYLS